MDLNIKLYVLYPYVIKIILLRNCQNHILARTMRHALKNGYVLPDDFRKTDDYVLEKIESRKDDVFINRNLQILSMEILPPDGPFANARTKFRYVDPLFWSSGRLVRVSERHPDFVAEVSSEGKRYKCAISIYDGK